MVVENRRLSGRGSVPFVAALASETIAYTQCISVVGNSYGTTYVWCGQDDLVLGFAELEHILPPSRTFGQFAFVAQHIDGAGCNESTDFSFPLSDQGRRADDECDGVGIERGIGDIGYAWK